MSKNPKESIIETLKNSLAAAAVDQKAVTGIVNDIIIELGKYSVTYTGTEVGFHDDGNDKLIRLYLGTIYTEGKSKNTIGTYGYDLKRFFNDVNKPAKDVNVYDIRLWLAEMQKTVSMSTCATYRACLNAFFAWLTAEEIINKNPVAKIKPIKYQVSSEVAFSEVEVDALRRSCKTERERAVLEVLLATGMRVTELADLNINDIDLSKKSIVIRHGKGNKQRAVYFTDLCAVHIVKYLKTRTDNYPQFLLTRNHTRMNKNTLGSEMQRVANRAGVEGMHCHRLRKTNAVNLLSRGVDIRTIQMLLGHANLDVTTRYLAVHDNHVEMQYRSHTA